jgi:hypothetical protein
LDQRQVRSRLAPQPGSSIESYAALSRPLSRPSTSKRAAVSELTRQQQRGPLHSSGDAARHLAPGDCRTCRPSSPAARPVEDLLRRSFARRAAGRDFPFQGFQLGWQHIDWVLAALTCRDLFDRGFRTGLMHTKMNPISRSLVIPAKARIQSPSAQSVSPCSNQGAGSGPRFRGGDGQRFASARTALRTTEKEWPC